MSEIAIDVRGLVKRFGAQTVVNGVNISLPKGQVWGFLGPNGSGKTTTIRMLTGLLKPNAGEGTCLGYDILRETTQIKRATGYMTQGFSFWGDLTVRENLDFVARIYKLRNRRQAVDMALEKLGLGQRQKQLTGTLSGGWKQRLALAAVTLHEPQLLLLDEPTAGVDPQARRDFWDEIHRLAGTGLTVLVATHYMDEAERCDQIVYIALGNLITQGNVADVIAHSGLVTFCATGPGVRQLAPLLKGRPGVLHVAFFGSALHASGTDREALRAAVLSLNHDGIWEEIKPSLEDTFIALMSRAGVDAKRYQ